MITITEERLRQILAWLVIALLVVPVGGALFLGVVQGESPCILCWAQRTSMILISLVALFVVRYGPRPRYLGMLMLLGAWGIWMSMRHSSLHLARDIGQGFAVNILGAHTYTWVFVIHWLVLLVAGVLLVLYRGPLGEPAAGADGASSGGPAGPAIQPGRAGRFAMGLLVVLVGANAVQAFISTGPPPFFGQGDPIRLSLNPSHWVWSMAEGTGPIGWRGSWDVDAPDPAATGDDPDPAHGPLAGLASLPVARWERVTAPYDGQLTGLAVAAGSSGADAEAGEDARVLAVTDRFGVYVLDAGMSRVLHRVEIDPAFSIDLTPLAGATFAGGDTVMVMSTNKSYVMLVPDPNADAKLEWRHFLDTDDTVTELRRSRFATIRARVQYALSLAYDPDAREYITVSVPNDHYPRWAVSRFGRGDRVLSSEFYPALGPGLEPAGPDRGLSEYHVTGAAVADGRLYAVSAKYSTLLVIDLASKAVTAAYAVPGLEDPVGVAARGDELLIAQADGRVAVVARP